MYNIWNKWSCLKTCLLGNNYLPEFFDGIPGTVGDPLKKICNETLEDLNSFKETLTQFGVEVIQPQMDPSERFMDHPRRYPRGPLQVRDHMLVLGNDCYVSNRDHPAIEQTLDNFAPTVKISGNDTLPYISHAKYMCYKKDDWPEYMDYLQNKNNPSYFTHTVLQEIQNNEYLYTPLRLNSASTMMVNDRAVVGGLEPGYETLPTDIMHMLYPQTKHFNIEWQQIEGHSDGQFHPIKEGAIISLHDVQTYSKTFPGWDVCYLPNQGNQHLPMKKWDRLKHKNKGKWWVAGEEDNDEFTAFVEQWLTDWVGYVEETVFDVNVLVIDEHHVCVSNTKNQTVNEFLKKHKMEPVYVPWRHRYFWDGGLHCITLDLARD